MIDELHGWGPSLDEIGRRKAETRTMGGEARLDRQRRRGRLNARERLDHLFDSGTFFEIGNLVGTTEQPPVPGDALVAGSGRINGRPALAGAEDVTVLGGSIGSGASDKRYRLCQLAGQERVPLVMMLEGAGHRVTDAAVGRRPGDLMGLAELSGVVPLVCLVLGASAGHGALTAPLCDFVAMTETASIFAAGPPLVRAATGEDVTKEVLGGPEVAIDSGGVVHNLVADDVEADRPRPSLPRPLPSQRLGAASSARRARRRRPQRRHPRTDPTRPSPAVPHSPRALGAGRWRRVPRCATRDSVVRS